LPARSGPRSTPRPRSTTLSWTHCSFFATFRRNACSCRSAHSSHPRRPASNELHGLSSSGACNPSSGLSLASHDPSTSAAWRPPARRAGIIPSGACPSGSGASSRSHRAWGSASGCRRPWAGAYARPVSWPDTSVTASACGALVLPVPIDDLDAAVHPVGHTTLARRTKLF